MSTFTRLGDQYCATVRKIVDEAFERVFPDLAAARKRMKEYQMDQSERLRLIDILSEYCGDKTPVALEEVSALVAEIVAAAPRPMLVTEREADRGQQRVCSGCGANRTSEGWWLLMLDGPLAGNYACSDACRMKLARASAQALTEILGRKIPGS